MKIWQMPLGPLQTNCYVLADDESGQAAVIDPAAEGRLIAEKIAGEGWKTTHILLTHSHFDHVGGLAELKELTGAPIYMHPDAQPMLEMAAALAQNWEVEIAPPPPIDISLAEGDEIVIGSLRLVVLFTPGHAPGHVSFSLPDHGILFDGDVLFSQGIGRTDLPGADHRTLIESIRKQVMVLPDDTVVLSGHGEPTSIGRERATNPFLEY